MERNPHKTKLQQQLAIIEDELKRMDFDKLDVERQLFQIEKDLPKLKKDLDAAKLATDQKKVKINEHSDGKRHSVIKPVGVEKPSVIQKDDFATLVEKSAVDRDFAQKQREYERKVNDLHKKTEVLKKTQFAVARIYDEKVAQKRDLERELEMLEQSETFAKRVKTNKAEQKTSEEKSTPFEDEY
jgi:hypothetical protein